MNKKQVARILRKSVRAVEHYTTKGRLHPEYSNGKHGIEASYNKEEVLKLKEELQQPVAVARFVRAGAPQMSQQALIPVQPALTENLIAALEKLAGGERRGTTAMLAVAIESKLVLSLKEAALIAGISEERLKSAVKAKQLKGAVDHPALGRGYRIRRADLEAYVAKLKL